MFDLRSIWRRGPKRGIARGVGVFGSPGFADDAQGLNELLGRHNRLADWMRAAGYDLTVSAEGLQTVDAMIDTWRDNPDVAGSLDKEIGLFLGSVLIHELDGTRWHVWPNGHPVVRLTNGEDVDVTALAETRVRKGRPHLNAILGRAAAATGPRPPAHGADGPR